MRSGLFVQARMSSSRLPGKMLMKIRDDISLLEWVLGRCRAASAYDVIALVTSIEASDDMLAEECSRMGVPCFRGSLADVRQRYLDAATCFDVNYVCRVCGDSPFVDINRAQAMLTELKQAKADYIILNNTVPGFLSEVFSVSALKKSIGLDVSDTAKEHVTTPMRHGENSNCGNNNFKCLKYDGLTSSLSATTPKLTVDTQCDLDFARCLAKHVWINSTAEEILSVLEKLVTNNGNLK